MEAAIIWLTAAIIWGCPHLHTLIRGTLSQWAENANMETTQ